MIEVEVEYGTTPELTAEMVRKQLELLVRDDVFRSSKRSIAFLRYVVEQALNGSADQIKERSIGIEVFGRDPSYETNLDHIVRTAATELRKRLATYYVDEKHRAELRITLVPGSYVPRFTLPGQGKPSTEEDEADVSLPTHTAPIQFGSGSLAGGAKARGASGRRRTFQIGFAGVAVAAIACVGYIWLHHASAQDLFWKPVLDTPGPVLLAVGDHPNGPPTLPEVVDNESSPTPSPGSDASQTVPFADTVTIAKVAGVLAARNKAFMVRRGNSSSFSDLREGATVLIGAFNNEWSLRLTRQLRYSLALDQERHLIYIRDTKSPLSRDWSWATNQPSEPATGMNSPKMQDYALISRIRDAGTGHAVVVIGGLYTYGTLAAGEFLTDPELMREVDRQAGLNGGSQNLQIILETTVTDGVPGPPKVVAVSTE